MAPRKAPIAPTYQAASMRAAPPVLVDEVAVVVGVRLEMTSVVMEEEVVGLVLVPERVVEVLVKVPLVSVVEVRLVLVPEGRGLVLMVLRGAVEEVGLSLMGKLELLA
jgi:hypothetical protein